MKLDRAVEEHLAALVFARLVTARAIPLDDDTVGACLRALGLGRPVVRAAVAQLQGEGWRPLASARLVPLRAVPDPEQPRPIRGAGMRRTERQPGEPELRECRRCGDSKPVDEFRWYSKGKRQGVERFGRDPYCGPCRLEFQRERYLSGGKVEALRRIGVEVADDDVICVICGRPIRDERPIGLTVFAHAACGATRCRP